MKLPVQVPSAVFVKLILAPSTMAIGSVPGAGKALVTVTVTGSLTRTGSGDTDTEIGGSPVGLPKIKMANADVVAAIKSARAKIVAGRFRPTEAA